MSSTDRLSARALSRPHRGPLAVAAGLVLVEAAVELARPWPLQFVVDHGLQDRPLPTWAEGLAGIPVAGLAILAGLTVLLLTVVAAVAGLGSVLLVGRSAEGIGVTLRRDLVAKLLDRSPSFHRRHRAGDLVTRVVDDVQHVEDAVVTWWEVALPESVVLVGTMVLLTLIDPWLALAALAVCPLLVAVILHRRRLVRSAHAGVRDREGKLASRAHDLIRNVRVVQAFGHQQRAGAEFAGLSDDVRRTSLHAQVAEARLRPLADMVLAVGAGAVLVLGVVRVDQGAMTLGTLLVALTYVGGLYAPLRSLTSLSSTLARAQASRDRIHDVLDDSGEPTPPRAAAAISGLTPLRLRGDIEVDDVSFRYDGGPQVLDELSLRFTGGAVTALTGPTGAGKSTLLSLLLKLEPPTAGSIRVGGWDLTELDTAAYRRTLAYVPQESWFLDDTLRANIRLGRADATRAEVEQAARVAHVDEFTDRLPHGLDTVVGEAGLVLSGGQRRRLALARAVLRGADVLLLDEPTAGLDDAAADLVLTGLAAASAGRTVVVATHDPRVVRWADDVVHLGLPAPAHEPGPSVLSMGGR